MIVAVPPFQHSPMFGHWASSHTVASLVPPASARRASSDSLSSAYRVSEPPGAGTWNQPGRGPSGMSPPTLGRTGSERYPARSWSCGAMSCRTMPRSASHCLAASPCSTAPPSAAAAAAGSGVGRAVDSMGGPQRSARACWQRVSIRVSKSVRNCPLRGGCLLSPELKLLLPYRQKNNERAYLGEIFTPLLAHLNPRYRTSNVL